MSILEKLLQDREQARTLGREMLLRGIAPGATGLDWEQGQAAAVVLRYAEDRANTMSIDQANAVRDAAFRAGLAGETEPGIDEAIQVDMLSCWTEAFETLVGMAREREDYLSNQG